MQQQGPDTQVPGLKAHAPLFHDHKLNIRWGCPTRRPGRPPGTKPTNSCQASLACSYINGFLEKNPEISNRQKDFSPVKWQKLRKLSYKTQKQMPASYVGLRCEKAIYSPHAPSSLTHNHWEQSPLLSQGHKCWKNMGCLEYQEFPSAPLYQGSTN